MIQIRNLIVSYGALNSRERIFIAEEYSTFFPGFRVGLRSHNKANEKQKGSSSADSAVLHDFLTCAHAVYTQVGAGGLIASCGLHGGKFSSVYVGAALHAFCLPTPDLRLPHIYNRKRENQPADIREALPRRRKIERDLTVARFVYYANYAKLCS